RSRPVSWFSGCLARGRQSSPSRRETTPRLTVPSTATWNWHWTPVPSGLFLMPLATCRTTARFGSPRPRLRRPSRPSSCPTPSKGYIMSLRRYLGGGFGAADVSDAANLTAAAAVGEAPTDDEFDALLADVMALRAK